MNIYRNESFSVFVVVVVVVVYVGGVCVFFCYSFSSLLVTMLMRIIGKLNNSCATNTMKSEYNVFQFNNCHESDILP